MNIYMKIAATFLMFVMCTASNADHHEGKVVLPAKIDRVDAAGMFFLKDSVMTVHAGEAVTIPKEWTGTWDTDGYEKIWVIYSADGSGL